MHSESFSSEDLSAVWFPLHLVNQTKANKNNHRPSDLSDGEDAKTKRKRAKKEAKRDAKSNAAAQQAVGAEVRLTTYLQRIPLHRSSCIVPFFVLFWDHSLLLRWNANAVHQRSAHFT